MKKINVQLIIVFAIGAVLFKWLKPNQWNIIIYSILFFLFFFNFLQTLYTIYITRKGIYSLGNIKENSIEKSEDTSVDIKIIEFISPLDNTKYELTIDGQNLAADKEQFSNNKIRIWVNQKNPNKSLIVKELNSIRILSLVTLLVFSIIFLVLIAIS